MICGALSGSIYHELAGPLHQPLNFIFHVHFKREKKKERARKKREEREKGF